MIALKSDGLVAFGHGLSFGTTGCTTIRANLSHGPARLGAQSFLVLGINTVAKVNQQMTKIGLLGNPMRCTWGPNTALELFSPKRIL